MDLNKQITTLLPKAKLNPKLWDENLLLNSEVKANLLKIAEDFIVKSKIKRKIVKDIVVTGSIANYNWSKYSDIDLHLIIDFELTSNEELMKNYLDEKKSNWNNKHVIEMFGHEVEIYIQDLKEIHTSTGIFSIIKNKWIVVPTHITVKNLDRPSIIKKAKVINAYIRHLEDLFDKKEYEKVNELSFILKGKLRKMRKSGLDKYGEYSVENLAFKVLRRLGRVDKIDDLKTDSYDALLEVE